MKIAVTGGHPAPALAVIDYAREHKSFKDIDFVFIGRKYNNQREQSVSFEYKEIKERNIPFYHLTTGRLTRLISLQSLRNMVYIPFGFYNAWRILNEVKPDRILTFGGYLALPVAYIAQKMNIPVYIHEQTIAPGIATKKISDVATKVFLSFPDSQKDLPPEKCVVTGNVVRNAIFEKKKLPFTISSGKPVIYVTGGSLGSHSVNKHIENILTNLLEKYVVIHQTGNVLEYNDFERLSKLRESLPSHQKEHYIVLEHVSAEEIGSIYNASDIVVSRSGANTVTELVALKKPAIVVPLPWSARGEQKLQAQLLQKAGVAEIFEQHLSSDELLNCIEKVYKNREEMKNGFSKLTTLFNPDAPRTVMETVIQG